MPHDDLAALTATTPAQWLREFEKALAARDGAALGELFAPDAYWRDLLAFSWSIGWVHGADRIQQKALAAVDEFPGRDFRISTRFREPYIDIVPGHEVIAAFFEFDAANGHAIGVIKLIAAADAPLGVRAVTLMTTLDDLYGYEGFSQGVGKLGTGFDREDTKRNWLDRRAEAAAFDEDDPEAVVVGGGHSGLMMAARLGELGVKTLVVERNARIGDNWRNRYHSLVLHNKTASVCDFPYVPMPTVFPEYLPKDKLGNFLESYAELMELNCWTSSEFVGGSYDEDAERWTVTVRRADGAERTLRPQHVVMATGSEGGTPRIPSLPGLETFGGEILHTSQFTNGSDFADKKVLVIGAGTSAHDVSLDMYNHGAAVTMAQRGSTVVVNLDSANTLHTAYFAGRPTEEVDIMTMAGFIEPVLVKGLQAATVYTAELDRELLEGLERVGMRTDQGEDDSGYLMKFLRYGGGYYINVGASEVIVRGDIGVMPFDDIDTFVPEGVRLTDGSIRELDAVVLATGYLGPQTAVRAFFGDAVAEKVGVIGPYGGESGEFANTFVPTPQRGLWFAGGGIVTVRPYSLHLALLIKAAQLGKLPGYRGAPAVASSIQEAVA